MMETTSKSPEYILSQIYYYLTAGCNLACRHCWLSPRLQDSTHSHEVLSPDIFKSTIEQAKPMGLTTVKLTGGEPLMHPQFHDILDFIREQGLVLNLETNGVLCTNKEAEAIASCKDPFVSVSLDGATIETHEKNRGIKGCFSKAIEGILNLVETGIHPQIIMTLLPHNIAEIEPLVRLAELMGAESVKFNIVQPTGRGRTLNSEGETLSIDRLLTLGKWITGTLSHSTPVKLHFDVPSAFRSMSEIYGETGMGCSVCSVTHIMGVLADGSYSFCGIGMHVPELVFGHAATDSLSDIWHHHPILNELREGINMKFEGICGSCHMKRACAGYCIAQNYYRSRSLWKPFWFCEEAYNNGLFPSSRLLPGSITTKISNR